MNVYDKLVADLMHPWDAEFIRKAKLLRNSFAVCMVHDQSFAKT